MHRVPTFKGVIYYYRPHLSRSLKLISKTCTFATERMDILADDLCWSWKMHIASIDCQVFLRTKSLCYSKLITSTFFLKQDNTSLCRGHTSSQTNIWPSFKLAQPEEHTHESYILWLDNTSNNGILDLTIVP